ncbi:MAG: cellulase family glycosylhydrolase [Sandaracinaceae bacterium]|nr:cellulase family glycosylhydrolase [Sandaracinaceae bacterium]
MLRSCFAAALVLLVTAPAAADLGDNGIGINTHIPDDSTADMVRDLGANWIRVDANWFQLQPAADRYDWAVMDEVVDRANARGLLVYMTLAYTPAWVPRVAERHPDGNAGNDEPTTSTEWVAFVEAAVARYAARGVTHFGIWNEPNLEQFWDGDANAYVDRILVPGADAVRRTCASCRVLGPDLAHVGDYDVFLDRVLTRALASFDILAHHLYNGWPETGTSIFDGDRFLEALEMRRSSFTRASLREVLDRRGWTGEVWITETGYRANPAGDAGEESKQATYVTRVMEEQLLRPWWTNTFFYEAVDCVPFLPTCTIDGYGITRANHTGARTWPDDYRRKPAYDAIQSFLASHPELPADAPPMMGTPDAGAPSADAGTTPPVDAGAPGADAGTTPSVDVDAGASPPSGDAASGGADAGDPGGETSGGCAVGATDASPLAWAALFALAWWARRRRG